MSTDILETESLAIYTARTILKRLGIIEPNQRQIDIIDTLMAMIGEPSQVQPAMIRRCVGNADLAYCSLYLKNPEL